jgi:alanyl-tRNA synthetase
VDDTRYLEIWNLVFMQYLISNVTSKTEFTIDGELPQKNIDTGMGMERVAFIKQGVDNMYEIDQVRPVLDMASQISGRTYGANHEDDVRMRVIADHVRSSLMLMSDGVTPSNEGRGYILRRLLRRSVRSMRLLDVDAPTFTELFAASRDAMKGAYPDVEIHYDRISRTALGEEETFLRTLVSGTQILDLAVSEQKAAKAPLDGDTAFLLHDTYGFPIDLTMEMAEEAGVAVDRETFDSLMNAQRSRAKADAKTKRGNLADVSVYGEFRTAGETVFTGYDDFTTETTVIGIIKDGASVASANVGDTVELIVRETSLYAESGGQDADEGTIVGANFTAAVLDVQRPIKGLTAHTVTISDGTVGVDDAVTTLVDRAYRQQAAQAHSATHLVHAALRQTLGQDAHQAGSYNKAGYMRFDFAWNAGLSAATRTEIEDIANSAITDNLEVSTRVMSLDDAKAEGAMALFGEKYGDTVRVVDIGGPWSRELCAGTHVSRSSEIGLINLIGESSIGSSNRRVEALVGTTAFREFAAERALVAELTATLKTPKEELPQRIGELLEQLKNAERSIAKVASAALTERVPALAAQSKAVGKLTAVILNLGKLDSIDGLRQLATDVRDRLGSDASVVVLGAVVEGKAAVVAATNDAARVADAKAGNLAKIAAGILGGGGGGRDDMAQGGGPAVENIDAALSAIAKELAS